MNTEYAVVYNSKEGYFTVFERGFAEMTCNDNIGCYILDIYENSEDAISHAKGLAEDYQMQFV